MVLLKLISLPFLLPTVALASEAAPDRPEEQRLSEAALDLEDAVRADDACAAGAGPEGCEVSFRQLRGEQTQLDPGAPTAHGAGHSASGWGSRRRTTTAAPETTRAPTTPPAPEAPPETVPEEEPAAEEPPPAAVPNATNATVADEESPASEVPSSINATPAIEASTTTAAPTTTRAATTTEAPTTTPAPTTTTPTTTTAPTTTTTEDDEPLFTTTLPYGSQEALTMVSYFLEPEEGSTKMECYVKPFRSSEKMSTGFKVMPTGLRWFTVSTVLSIDAQEAAGSSRVDRAKPITLQLELDFQPGGEAALIRVGALSQYVPRRLEIPPGEYCEWDYCRLPKPAFETDEPSCGWQDRTAWPEQPAAKVLKFDLSKMLDARHTAVQVWAVPGSADGRQWQTPKFRLKRWSFTNAVE